MPESLSIACVEKQLNWALIGTERGLIGTGFGRGKDVVLQPQKSPPHRLTTCSTAAYDSPDTQTPSFSCPIATQHLRMHMERPAPRQRPAFDIPLMSCLLNS